MWALPQPADQRMHSQESLSPKVFCDRMIQSESIIENLRRSRIGVENYLLLFLSIYPMTLSLRLSPSESARVWPLR